MKIGLFNEDEIEKNPYTRLNVFCHSQPPHGHTFFEFALVLNGVCRHSLNGNPSEELPPGTLLLIRPNEYHEIGFSGRDCIYRDYYVTQVEMQKICAGLGDGFYDELMSRAAPCKATLAVNELDSLAHKSAYFNNDAYMYNEKQEQLSRMHRAIIVELLGKFIEQSIPKNIGAPDWLNDLHAHLTYFDYINLSLDEIIKKTGYSHGYVSQMFKKYFNVSLISYHNKNKVIYSCKLLGNMKIIDISSMLGWENPKNYAIEFKKVFGCSPSQYLKAEQKVK